MCGLMQWEQVLQIQHPLNTIVHVHAKVPGPDPPIFISNHYYCETGNIGIIDSSVVYTDDPLWDGAGCQPGNTCCTHVGTPWFFCQFPVKVEGEIEVRICKDSPFTDEDVALEQLELYVQ